VIDYDKKIFITNWKTKDTIERVTAIAGLAMMARSTRWGDPQQCRSDVRKLNNLDAATLGVESLTPVTFSQPLIQPEPDDCPFKVGQRVKFDGEMTISHEGTIPDGATATYRGRSECSENYYLFELDEDHGFLIEGYGIPNVFLGDGFCFDEDVPEIVVAI